MAGCELYYLHPEYLNVNCSDCRKYESINGIPLETNHVKMKRISPYKCDLCKKNNFKYGWLRDNELIFNLFFNRYHLNQSIDESFENSAYVSTCFTYLAKFKEINDRCELAKLILPRL
jgi:uncharacterized protein YlaI